MKKIKIAFVCTHNSCRSIMAEGYMRKFSDGKFYVASAGTEKNDSPKKLALEVMRDDNINTDYAYSKLIDTLPLDIDILITMGCGVKCPSLSAKYREDFGITDPSGGPKSEFTKTRDIVKSKVLNLIERIENDQIPNI